MPKKLRLIKLGDGKEQLSELDIQKTFEQNLSDFEPGLKLVTSFLQTNVGIIDTLALDEDNRPTVIEFKGPGASSQDALIQALDYTVWCRNNFSFVEKTIRKNLESLKKNQELVNDIRIIVAASDFDERTKRSAYGIEHEVKLVAYRLFERVDEVWILPIVEVDTAVGGRSTEVLAPKSKDDHFINRPREIVDLYEKFEKNVRQIGADVQVNYKTQSFIGIKNARRNFIGVNPKLNWIRLDLPLTPDEAKSSDYKWADSWGGWGYIHLTDKTYDESMRLVRLAYEKLGSQ